MEPLALRHDAIPDELKALRQWVVWKLEIPEGEDRETKVPYNARTGRKASSTRREDWSSFDQSLQAVGQRGGFAGVGFVFSPEDPYLGVDFDKCLSGGRIEPWAERFVELLASYTEVSPSGTGLKVWVRAKHPGRRRKMGGLGPEGSGAVEMYDRSRYFTVTGRVFGDRLAIEARQGVADQVYREVFGADGVEETAVMEPRPLVEIDDLELIQRACAARNGSAFERLWRGDVGAHNGDESRADLALCRHLAFWAGGDKGRMDRLFRSSGLMRAKWERRSDYRERTLTRALSGVREFYTPQWQAEAKVEVERSGSRESKGKNQATLLVELAQRDLNRLLHTPEQDEYAVVRDGDVLRTWRIRSQAFRSWLQWMFLQATGGVPGGQAIQDAVNTLAGFALHDGRREEVFTRVAACGDEFWLNLGDQRGRVVRISASGWEVRTHAPVAFRHPKGMLALPEPKPGGSLGLLRPFVNVTDEQWPLIVGWLLAALRPWGPYPVAELRGEQGCAKSTTARVLRSITDPAVAGLRAEPKNSQDLVIAAKNSWVLAYDNLSGMPPWLSDGLCRVATGGGLGTRELYTNDEEALFDCQRPVILTGIGGVASRADLLDRTLLFDLPTISERKRKTEAEFWEELEAVRALILGALLDGLATGLARHGVVRPDRLPRMADFVAWVVAAEPGVGWSPGTFRKAFDANQESANTVALENSPIGDLVVSLVVAQGNQAWEGTFQQLLECLATRGGEAAQRRRDWPKNARALSLHLKRVGPNLRAEGVDVEDLGKGSQGRRVRLCRSDANAPGGDANPILLDANAEADTDGQARGDANDGDDESAGGFSDAYIPPQEWDGSGEVTGSPEEGPEFASLAFASGTQQETVFRLAEDAGYPWVTLSADVRVGGSRSGWADWVRWADAAEFPAVQGRLVMLKNAEGSSRARGVGCED